MSTKTEEVVDSVEKGAEFGVRFWNEAAEIYSELYSSSPTGSIAAAEFKAEQLKCLAQSSNTLILATIARATLMNLKSPDDILAELALSMTSKRPEA